MAKVMLGAGHRHRCHARCLRAGLFFVRCSALAVCVLSLARARALDRLLPVLISHHTYRVSRVRRCSTCTVLVQYSTVGTVGVPRTVTLGEEFTPCTLSPAAEDQSKSTKWYSLWPSNHLGVGRNENTKHRQSTERIVASTIKKTKWHAQMRTSVDPVLVVRLLRLHPPEAEQRLSASASYRTFLQPSLHNSSTTPQTTHTHIHPPLRALPPADLRFSSSRKVRTLAIVDQHAHGLELILQRIGDGKVL